MTALQGDLATQIKAAKRNLFSESKILHWFVQLTLGLHYMHSNKVLHRDLKTQNVFMLGNGRLVLGDLGISKVLDGTMDFAQTCIGTPYCKSLCLLSLSHRVLLPFLPDMSPEIFQNKPYSYKSDVWALGCVLYEMTTLNHAFDANSLNGLATKIIKGKYPPVNAKYSKYLRELIGQMLMLNPAQRPDLDQILRKPFIKKHIVNFFVDIASRPSQSLGEGTMIFKAAAGGQAMGSIMNDSNMISLRQQLHSLDMTQAVAEAMGPKPMPVDDQEAIKLAREQASALKREQDHKKMVEAALAKLAQDREQRSKQRVDPYRASPAGQAGAVAAPSARPGAPLAAQRDPRRMAPAPIPAPAPVARAPEAARKEAAAIPSVAAGVRDRGINWMRRDDPPAAAAAQRDDINGRRRSYGEDQDRSRDREREARKAAEDSASRRKALQEADSRARAEDRRRDEVKAESRAREEARMREEAKAKEEQMERLRIEQVREKAEAAARAKREAQREAQKEKDKEAQRAQIEQLKRDKLELDRRTLEKEKQRAERQKQAQLGAIQSKLDIMNDEIGRLEPPRRAEEKEDLTSKERVFARKQEKQAKEEADRLDALREAENENRRLRQQAQENKSKIYADNARVLPGYAANNNKQAPAQAPTQGQGYEFDRNRNKASRMDNEELTDRLDEVTRGKGSRFDSSPSLYSEVPVGKAGRSASDLGGGAVRSQHRDRNGLEIHTDDESDEEMWDNGAANVEEEEEDMRHREEELRQELQFATQRCEDLRRTLNETKSFLGPRLPTRGKDIGNPPPRPKQVEVYAEEEDDDEELFDLDDEEEDYEVSSSSQFLIVCDACLQESWEDPNKNRKQPSNSFSERERRDDRSDMGGDSTLRRVKADPVPNYGDASPSGRLSDRIERLRQLCIEALGRDAFFDAYHFLKQHEEVRGVCGLVRKSIF